MTELDELEKARVRGRELQAQRPDRTVQIDIQIDDRGELKRQGVRFDLSDEGAVKSALAHLEAIVLEAATE